MSINPSNFVGLSHTNCLNIAIPRAPGAKRYAKLCGLSSESWCKLAILIAKAALSIFILPLFFKSYYEWVENSHKDLLHSLKQVNKGRPQALVMPLNGDRKKQLKVCSKWEFLTLESRECESEYAKIKDRVESVSPGPAFGKVYNVPNEYNLWMPAMAVGAHYLSKKTGVKGLFVCQTLEAFQKKFNDVLNHPEDQRCSFILPCFSSTVNFPPNTAQHKVCVCMEKKGTDIHIALMDSQPLDFKFNPDHCRVEDDLWKEGDGFNVQELIYRPILKSSFEGLNPHFYISTVPRQKSGGCAIYALRDGVEFLRDADFFEEDYVDRPRSTYKE